MLVIFYFNLKLFISYCCILCMPIMYKHVWVPDSLSCDCVLLLWIITIALWNYIYILSIYYTWSYLTAFNCRKCSHMQLDLGSNLVIIFSWRQNLVHMHHWISREILPSGKLNISHDMLSALLPLRESHHTLHWRNSIFAILHLYVFLFYSLQAESNCFIIVWRKYVNF